MNKKLVTRIDKAIKELQQIKLELQKTEQAEMFIGDAPNCPDLPVLRDAKDIVKYLGDLRIRHKLSVKPLKMSFSRLNLVKSRLSDSSIEEAIKVIDTRFHLWVNDDKQRQYLTIETIFRPSKYYKYVDDIEMIEKTMNKSFTDTPSTLIPSGSWTD